MNFQFYNLLLFKYVHIYIFLRVLLPPRDSRVDIVDNKIGHKSQQTGSSLLSLNKINCSWRDSPCLFIKIRKSLRHTRLTQVHDKEFAITQDNHVLGFG